MFAKRLAFVTLTFAALALLAACGGPSTSRTTEFVFPDATGVDPSRVVTSAAVTVMETGPVTAAVSGGAELVVNGHPSGDTAQVRKWDRLAVRLTASPTFEESVTATATLASSTTTFRVTTRGPIVTAQPFDFEPVDEAEHGVRVSSAAVTIVGPEVPVLVSVTGAGEPRLVINDGAMEDADAVVRVSDGDTLSVSLVPGEGYGVPYEATVTVGSTSATFVVTTVSVPDWFEIPDLMSTTPGMTVRTEPVTVEHLLEPLPLTIETEGDGSATLEVVRADGGGDEGSAEPEESDEDAAPAPVLVGNGDQVRVAVVLGTDAAGPMTVTLTLGDMTTSFRVGSSAVTDADVDGL